MKFSIIIPAYNEEEYLPETLEYLQHALLHQSSETIVVDNESHDNTKRVAEAFGVTVVLETQHNISIVRNTGATHATGDVLVFVDADTLVPTELFQRISEAMKDEKCFGGAVSVEYANLQRKWMKVYLLAWQFWGRVFNMRQGAAQFCRKPVFDEIQGYNQSIFMGEDIEFYWRLSSFTLKRGGHLYFIEEPKVTTSGRRFNKMGIWRTLLLTHPIFIYLMRRRKSFWKDWYEDSPR